MATGSKIVTNGLVFNMDAANIKSFRGEPTTNLSYNNGQTGSEYLANPYNWVNSGAWTLNSNDTSIDKPFGYNSNNYRIISGLVTSTGSSASIMHGCGLTSTQITGNTTYTMSVYFRQNRAGGNSPYLRALINNNNLGNFDYNGNSNATTWPINEWLRISASAVTQSNETGLFLSNYLSTYMDVVYYFGHQIEQKSHSTPIILGTRGTTVATGGGWKDLSSSGYNGTLTSDGIYYNSANKGSLTFYSGITLGSATPLLYPGTSDYTWNGWINLSNQINQYRVLWRGNAVGGTHGFGLMTSTNSNDMRVEVYGTINGRQVYTHSFNSYIGGWHYYSYIIVQSLFQIKIYIDGNYLTTLQYPNWGSIDQEPGVDITIGSYYTTTYWPFSNKISLIQIYRKALSSAEILQNYNATKSRYIQ